LNLFIVIISSTVRFEIKVDYSALI